MPFFVWKTTILPQRKPYFYPLNKFAIADQLNNIKDFILSFLVSEAVMLCLGALVLKVAHRPYKING